MALGKQAKVLSKHQIDGVLAFLGTRLNGLRDQTIFLLSVRAGFRAKEIASLKWSMITTPDGRQTPVSRIGFESLLKLDLTASAQKSAFDGQKARAEVDKIASEAEENRANAGKLRTDARYAGPAAGKGAPANAGV